MMIDLGMHGSVNSDHIMSTMIDRRFYMNGSATYLILYLSDGRRLSIEHGYGIDVHKLKERIDGSA